ncbi:MAG: MFS transporter [Candidatus Thorarchaeota archaeon]|nr:MFS transporter [Candidatus Thorarchaeota archaeon]
MSQDEQTDQKDSDGIDPSKMSWFQSVRHVTKNRNWTLYLITVWIYGAMNVLYQYFNLYFRDIGISYISVGILTSGLLVVRLFGNLISGYLADNFDRRKLSVFTMVFSGIGYMMLVYVQDFLLVAISMIIMGLSAFTGTAGIAYQMQQVDRRFGGVAQSLFNLGSSLGLLPLYFISVLLGAGYGFISVMQILLFGASILYFVCAGIRAFGLKSIPIPRRKVESKNVLRDFMVENIRGLKLLVRVFPVFIAVICIDALSDSFYGFANTYYLNETLNYGLGEINLMFLLTLLISIPLTLYLGRFFDKHGGRKLTIAVYSVMPVSISLLIIARFVPNYTPDSWLVAIDQVYPGLGIIFTLAFLATAMKSINDILWWSVLGTYIQKSLPRQDLGKLFSLTTVIILAVVSIGPIPAGWIYTNWQGLPLLFITLIINIVILLLLLVKNFEPRLSVDELEKEMGVEQKIEIVEVDEEIDDDIL